MQVQVSHRLQTSQPSPCFSTQMKSHLVFLKSGLSTFGSLLHVWYFRTQFFSFSKTFIPLLFRLIANLLKGLFAICGTKILTPSSNRRKLRNMMRLQLTSRIPRVFDQKSSSLSKLKFVMLHLSPYNTFTQLFHFFLLSNIFPILPLSFLLQYNEYTCTYNWHATRQFHSHKHAIHDNLTFKHTLHPQQQPHILPSQLQLILYLLRPHWPFSAVRANLLTSSSAVRRWIQIWQF